MPGEFFTIVAPISFGIQHLIQIADFLISRLLAKRFQNKYQGELSNLALSLGADTPDFAAYKRSWLGFLSLLAGMVVVARFPDLRILKSIGIPSDSDTSTFVNFLTEFVDVVLTGIAIGSGTEGANTLLKYFSAVKDKQSNNTITGASTGSSAVPNTAGWQGVLRPGGVIDEIDIILVYLGKEWKTDASYQQRKSQFEVFLSEFLSVRMTKLLTPFIHPPVASGEIKGGSVGSVFVKDDVTRDLFDVDVSQSTVEKLDQNHKGMADQSYFWTLIRLLVSENALNLSPRSHFCFVLTGSISFQRGDFFQCNDLNAYHQWAYLKEDGLDKVTYSVVGHRCPDHDLTALDFLTANSSHEIMETVTDPFLNTWFNSNQKEVCDLFEDEVDRSWNGHAVAVVANMDGTRRSV